MAHEHTWTENLGSSLRRTGNKVLDVFRKDITDTKWGHRVLDQIFREGKFSSRTTGDKNGTDKAD